MITGDSGEQSEVKDFGEVLGNPVDGQLPLMVGGQAVNLWALLFGDRLDAALQNGDLLPLTSKDLDLYGNQHLLNDLKRRFGGSIVMSVGRSPVIGQLRVNLGGKLRTIEVLRDVRGMTAKDLESAWLPVAFDKYNIRIPLPTVLLKAKLTNADQIDQTDRNDVKHVKIMIMVVREYLLKILNDIEAKEINDPRIGVKALEDALAVISSPESERCSNLHGIDFNEVWPYEALRSAQSQPIVNFVKHRLPQIDPAPPELEP